MGRETCEAIILCCEEYLDCIADDCTTETASDVGSACGTALTECTSAAYGD
jgi:hypothetical protein